MLATDFNCKLPEAGGLGDRVAWGGVLSIGRRGELCSLEASREANQTPLHFTRPGLNRT